MRNAKRPLTIIVLLLSVVLFAGACGDSNDPESWADGGDNIRDNFNRACEEANAEDGADRAFSDPQQLANYCECAFSEIVEYYGGTISGDKFEDVAGAVVGRDFQAFKDLESELRNDPASIPADIEAMLNGCANNA